ncbi:bifunctional nicotinamidase/pyrazinamidase [Microvirga lotononidis]|uniref:Nicotinamidase n=1 Tax=Microvirga lotononidis TaxID=864069 RepID=I4YY86_9HYPH|nr:bifunctional nicotinamidase/pyrazinamidase [Microvirga lotononidis]EIM28928.1 nicotinamidase-like amidase [Microvirga lotononidis]WQO26847.1 bifunctional nicotinamidase/pyrazinamidase [Microvirga lotononidis]
MTERATIEPGEHDVLIVVDVQVDFLPGGALAVPEGDAVIAPINRLAKLFRHVVLTQDWHPEGHASFASSHPQKQLFETTELHYGPQVLWPDHCVQGTPGAEFARDLDIPHAQLVIRKGYNAGIDSYSGFKEADRRTSTGLAGYLKERGFRRVFCAGLALDFCVAWTALDAVEAGFDTYLIEDASRAIDTGGSLASARRDLEAAGVHMIRSGQIVGD